MTDLEFGLHFSCQSPEREWEHLYRETLKQAQIAEEVGYSSIFLAEHHFLDDGWVPAPTVMLGGIAAVTDEMRLGTDIIVLPLHHPIEVAEQSVVLDLLTSGNFHLGVAIGWRDEEFAAFGVNKGERVVRTEEGIELARKLFEEENVDYGGKVFSADDVTLMPRPVGDTIPIWIGGQSKPAIARAARMGDAWVTSQIETIDELEEEYAFYDSQLEKAGRSPDEVHKPLRREAYIGEDDETAWEEVGESLLYEYGNVYGDYEDGGHVFTPGDDAIAELQEHSEDRFVVGGPETAIREFERYQERLGVDEFLLRMHFPGLDPAKAEKSMRIFAEEVMPHFQD
jgi:probable F420-dependent oxidoreductase